MQTLRELVTIIRNEEDTPTRARFDPEERVEMTSSRQHHLFQLLHILRRLDPDLTESLIGAYPELAAAPALFPYGKESVQEEWKNARRPRPRQAVKDTSCLVPPKICRSCMH